MREVLTTRGWSFVSAGVVLAAAGLLLGLRDLTRIGALLLVIALVAGRYAARRVVRFDADRRMTPTHVSVGDQAMITLELTNTGTHSTPLLLAEERVDYVLGDRPRFLVARTGPGETRRLDYHVRSQVRGIHTLGPVIVQMKDPFGLTLRWSAVGETTAIVVRPAVIPLAGNQPPGSGIGAEGEIPFMVALHGDEDVSIREYRDGDDLRRIHWPATAHSGELMVRQEDRPARRRAVVVLDSRAQAHFGTGVSSSFEWAVTAAASIVAHLTAMEYVVHLVTVESVASARTAEPMTHEAALEMLAVAQLHDDEQSEGYGSLIRATNTHASAGGLVIVVGAAPFMDDMRRLAGSRHQGMTGLAIIVDTVSFADLEDADEMSRVREVTRGAHGAESLDLFLSSGWSTVAADRTHDIGSVWAGLTARQRAGVRS